MVSQPSLFAEPNFRQVDIFYILSITSLGIIGNIFYTVAVR